MRYFAHQNGQRLVNWRARAERLRALSLPEILKTLEAARDPHDPAKWHTPWGILSVNGPQFMNWTQGVGGGGAIDLVMHLKGLGFGQALEWLELHFARNTPAQPALRFKAQTLALPRAVSQNWPRVERYLRHERKLPLAALKPLVQTGTLYADARCNAAFLLLDSADNPVGAELRGTTACSWRGMAPGSRKDRGFFSVSRSTSHAVVLCESAIDAISCHALHPDYRCLSTSGARPDPAWLPALISEGLPIHCGFDADPTGDAMAQRMHQLHPSIRRLRPTSKDWNDLLRKFAH